MSARHPAGAGDWPGDGLIGDEVDEATVRRMNMRKVHKDKENGERENAHPSHLHTLALT